MGFRFGGQKANKPGKMSITVIVLIMIGVMSVQIVDLYEKDQKYSLQEKELEKEKQAELVREKELEEYEKYTQTQEYIEDMAKSRLGLVYEDEIVFKEE